MTDAHNPATNSRMNGKATSADFDAFVDDLVKGANNGFGFEFVVGRLRTMD
jgi:hypothetical protein